MARSRSDVAVAGAFARIQTLESEVKNPTDNITLADNKRLILKANTPTSGISRLITLQMTTEYDRPWISYLDEFGRHRTAVGYHSRDYESGNYHNAYEVKTSADPGGSNPADMRTRLSIQTDVQRGQVTFPYVTYVEANQGEVAASTAFGFRMRATRTTGGTDHVIGNLFAQLDASDNATVYLDAIGPTASLGATLAIFRNVSSTSASNPSFRIKKGDGTNTDVFALVTGGNSAAPTLTLYDAASQGFNINTGTQTGLKIGTATTQKIGFFNKTPIVQPSAIGSPTADVTSLKTAVDNIRTALTNLGLTA